jgi:hypothetical protein
MKDEKVRRIDTPHYPYSKQYCALSFVNRVDLML